MTPRTSQPGRAGSPRRVLLLAVTAVVLGGCVRDVDPGAEPPSVAQTDVASQGRALPIHGVWDLADLPPDFGECHEASIGFRPDGRYMAKSGDQVVTGRYVAERAVVGGRPGYLVVQRAEAHNGRPNCQGVPAARSIEASPPDAFIAVESEGGLDRARVYFGGQSAEPAAELVRRTP